MNFDLIFGLLVVGFVIFGFIIIFACYQSTLNKNLSNRGQNKKHFPLAFYISSVVAVASVGSGGFYFARHLGKYYYFHPFSASISGDITELNYANMFHQLQNNSGSDEDLTVRNNSKINVVVDKSNDNNEISFRMYGKKNRHNVRFICVPARPLDITCSTQYHDILAPDERAYLKAMPYFEKLTTVDFKLLLMSVENSEKYSLIISFHHLDMDESKMIYGSFKIEDGKAVYYSSLKVIDSYIMIYLIDDSASQGENQMEWSYIVQV